MSKLIFAFLLATSSLLGQQHNPHCPFLVGVQMPAGKYPMKQVLYFVQPYSKTPQCFIDKGEAEFIIVNKGLIEFAGKPEDYITVRCREAE